MKDLSRLNLRLLGAAAVLLLLSAFTYRNSVQRAERFERGQSFLSNLNPDEIVKIEIKKGDDTTLLERTDAGDRFVLASADGYYAANGEVNRFIKDVLGIGLEKEIGENEGLHGELGLVSGGEETLEVAFTGAADKEMVRFLVGSADEGGVGSYVRRADAGDSTVYLTERRVYLDTDAESFLDKQILDVQRDAVVSIRGAGYSFARAGVALPQARAEGAADAPADDGAVEGEAAEGEDLEPGELELADLPEGKKESPKAGQLKGALSNLRFTEHHLANAAEVAGLAFDTSVEFLLDDGSGYLVSLAQSGDKHFLKVEAFHTAGRIMIAQDADEDEVRETSEILERADEIQLWNAFHGSWVYGVTDVVANRFRGTAAELVEDA